MDDIENKGKRYALLTNVGIVLAAVGLVMAGIAGYPLVLRPSEKPKTAFIFTPDRDGHRRRRASPSASSVGSAGGGRLLSPACRCRSRATPAGGVNWNSASGTRVLTRMSANTRSLVFPCASVMTLSRTSNVFGSTTNRMLFTCACGVFGDSDST